MDNKWNENINILTNLEGYNFIEDEHKHVFIRALLAITVTIVTTAIMIPVII